MVKTTSKFIGIAHKFAEITYPSRLMMEQPYYRRNRIEKEIFTCTYLNNPSSPPTTGSDLSYCVESMKNNKIGRAHHPSTSVRPPREGTGEVLSY